MSAALNKRWCLCNSRCVVGCRRAASSLLTGWIAASQLDAITLTHGGRFGCVPGFHRRGDRSIQLLIIATAACFRRTPQLHRCEGRQPASGYLCLRAALRPVTRGNDVTTGGLIRHRHYFSLRKFGQRVFIPFFARPRVISSYRPSPNLWADTT